MSLDSKANLVALLPLSLSLTFLSSSQAKASYASYYRNSLLYLACINVDRDLSPEERAQRAHDLGVSALLGETIYNFGELVSDPS